MSLHFSETVNVNYFNVSTVQLQSTRVRGVNTSVVYGTNPAGVSTAFSNEVNVTFSVAQMTLLQLSNGIGTLVNSTYVSIGYGACIDMSDNANVYQGTDATSSSARRVRYLTKDATRPTMRSAAMDMTLQTITFTFSEIIMLSSLTSTQVTIQSQSRVSSSTEAVSGLTSSKAALLTKKNSITLKYQMTLALFTLLKTSNALGRSLNTTFVSFSQLFVTDVGSPANQITPISTAAAMPFAAFTVDTIPPHLTSWYFDNDASILYMTFSEPLDTTTMDVTQITLTSDRFDSPATESFTLTTTTVVSGLASNSLTVIVQLSNRDANIIKESTPLCVSHSTCYLSFGATLGTDTPTYQAKYVHVVIKMLIHNSLLFTCMLSF
jgi:hypothetical protein